MYYDPAATGERIQNLRKDREVTQEQLAIDLNISDRYMRNLEKGEKVPSVDLFVELRERFGSSLDYTQHGVRRGYAIYVPRQRLWQPLRHRPGSWVKSKKDD